MNARFKAALPFLIICIVARSPALADCLSQPAGLIGWWQGEGNAYDAVAGRNGVTYGNLAFTNGEAGQAFLFNASDAEVALGNWFALTNFSVSLWVYPAASQQWYANILDDYGTGTSSWNLQYNNTGLQFHFGTPPVGIVNFNLTNSVWQHLAVTVDTNNVICVYLNGSLQGSATNSQSIPYDGSQSLHFGRWAGGGRFFNGKLDDIEFYSRALSQTEVQAIHAAGSASLCPIAPSFILQPASQTNVAGNDALFTSLARGSSLAYQWYFDGGPVTGATSPQLSLLNVSSGQAGTYSVLITNSITNFFSTNAVLTIVQPTCASLAGLIGWWQAETNAYDAASANNGAIYGPLNFTNGKAGAAFAFSANAEVAVGNWFNLTNFSVSLWVKPDAAQQAYANVIDNYGTDLASWNVQYNNTGLQFHFGTPPIGIVNFELTPDRWQHLAATVDSNNVICIYLNGQLQGSVTNSQPVPYDGSQYLRFARWAGGGRFFNGALDEILLFRRALSITEVQAIYNASTASLCPIPPGFVLQPASQTVTLGNDAVFSSLAIGSTIGYDWFFGSNAIAEATTPSLLLLDVQANDAGPYHVRVTNSFPSIVSSNAFLTVTQAVCTPVPPGVVSWWRAENDANDFMHTNDGSMYPSITVTNGKVSQAFSFDGSSAYVDVPASPSLDVGSGPGLTVEAWIQPADTDNAYPLVEWDDGCGDFAADLWINAAGSGALSAEFYDTNWNYYSISSFPGIVTTNDFQHVALTYDQASGGACLFYNGFLVATQFLGSFTPATAGYDVFFGLRPCCDWYGAGSLMGGSSGSLTNSSLLSTNSQGGGINSGSPSLDDASCDTYYSGLMDEVTLYSRALDPSEIQAIYTAGSAGKCTQSLLIVSQPTDQTVAQGNDAIFTVGASGTPPVGYQWKHDGTNIAGATSSSLVLTNVQSSQAGTYAVVVTNASASIPSANAVLNVVVPPTITSSPSDQTVSVGDNVSFNVAASGTPPLAYLWQHDGTNLAGAFGTTLTLSNVQPCQAGTYDAVVTNLAGSAQSDSAMLTVCDVPVVVSLSSNTNPSIFGQMVTFTANVTSCAGTPTGMVTFKDGGTSLGSRPLNGSGQASFNTASLSVAPHSITAAYYGDGCFLPNSSSVVTQTVNQCATTVDLSSSANPAPFGTWVTFTATPSAIPPGSGTATGTVIFSSGTNTLGTGTLSSGQATYTTSGLPVGSDPITANYVGDVNFLGSSGAMTQQVTKASTTASVSSSLDPSIRGDSVVFSASVSVVAPGSGTPAGTVIFMDGASPFGTNFLDAGTTSWTNADLSAGIHSISAVYSGTSNFYGCASAGLGQVVHQTSNSVSSATTLAASPSSPYFGQAVTLSATVSGTNGTPTGTIVFSDGATALSTNTLAADGTASFTHAGFVAGNHTFTAAYSGNATYDPSTGTNVLAILKTGTETLLALNPFPPIRGSNNTFTATITAALPPPGLPPGIAPTGTVELKQAPFPFFQNGDFENWTFQPCDPGYTGTTPYLAPGWIESGDINNAWIQGWEVHSGTWALEAAGDDPAYISQKIPVLEGQTYQLSFWAKIGAGDTNNLQVFWNGQQILDATNLPETDWTNIQLAVRAPLSVPTELKFGFRNPADSIYLDDITFTGQFPTLPTPIDFTATLDSSGVATFSALDVGADHGRFTASYSGDANFISSSTACYSFDVPPSIVITFPTNGLILTTDSNRTVNVTVNASFTNTPVQTVLFTNEAGFLGSSLATPFSFVWTNVSNGGHIMTATAVDAFGLASTASVRFIATDDSDGDGLPDWWEQLYFGHLGVDPNADAAGDGLTNYEKYLLGLNPLVSIAPPPGGGVNLQVYTPLK
ncbi:MAG: hypothetical protein C5B50_23380 [Verrucomicrobia bacterium]|nr:MAG: hypothetical protein C5B50_23380 [Verrucomicrobiota bacterium]